MLSPTLQSWLQRLGYAAEPQGLHRRDDALPETHPYALEIGMLLNPRGAVRAQAVFDIEGVPSVVFVGSDDRPLSPSQLDEARQRIWNQNLANVIIEVRGDTALAVPARKLPNAGEQLNLAEATPDGPFSALDIASANLARRKPAWFEVKARVDRQLLSNLTGTVTGLTKSGFDGVGDEELRRSHAEALMGQVLFVSYLEHREIVGATYRSRRGVDQLHSLIQRADSQGVRSLIDSLNVHFNGDFLAEDRHDPWRYLTPRGFETLDLFLRRTDMRTGQGSFWNYDFSYIPVELLSGIYESFLTPEEQAKEGAYYTPRNLAMLAVDQAFLTSLDPLAETIFDGACGSGILLTTAYRRIIALAEKRAGGVQLGFAKRAELLKSKIFGGDVNPMACRVTALSLYLSLLEGLDPSDIMEAQEREGVTLPSLDGTNLAHGTEHGDFFRRTHRFAGERFSLLISNPPWAEPAGAEVTSADSWTQEADVPFVRRQVAGAYALRALDFLTDRGRLCLILPIGQFLATTSERFVSHFFSSCRPIRLINFGDLQGLLFPVSEDTCHVFVGERRSEKRHVAFGETFDYLVPKADVSLALGRLTMQSADRHIIQTRSALQDPQLLVSLMWGDANDLAIWNRLTARGTLSDFWSRPGWFRSKLWTNRKGIHLRDKNREGVSAQPLKERPFLPVSALRGGVPILHSTQLSRWPEDQETVVGLTEEIWAIFDGPRVLFSDGFSKQDHTIRSVFYDGPATFTHSVGVIAGPQEDSDLLQFVAVYLRSSLARYFLMLRAWKMLCERNGVHLTDIESFPFFDVKNAPDPDKARVALSAVRRHMDELRDLSILEQEHYYGQIRATLDQAVFNYFGLADEEQQLIRESVDILMPSIRPRSYTSLDTPAQQVVSPDKFTAYAHALGEALTTWRMRTKGRGRFHVKVVANDPKRAGPSGIVRVTYSEDPTGPPEIATDINDELVQTTLNQLRADGLRVIPSRDMLAFVPDVRLWAGGSLYLVRLLAQRNWTLRQALRDAEHIVRTVQESTTRQAGQVA